MLAFLCRELKYKIHVQHFCDLFQGPRGLRGLQGPMGAVGDRVSVFFKEVIQTLEFVAHVFRLT